MRWCSRAGPAGTGKTWLAVAHAVQLFERKEVDRIVLSRPAVEAGERLGFLPGDMREKVDPYLRPIYDALYDLMDARIVERAMQTGEIEIAPLAFMRGRTLSNAVVILDEAQNTTSMQMKMFLTRLGENSRMIVTGDPSQVDLPHGQTSGLHEAMRLLRNVEGIGHVIFTAEDVIRHELVARIVDAYDQAALRPRGRRESEGMRSAWLHVSLLGEGEWKVTLAMRKLARTSRAAQATRHGRYRRQFAALEAAPRRRRRCCGGRSRQAAAMVSTTAGELAIVLTDDSAIRALNRDWRGKDAATNVCRFRCRPRDADAGRTLLLGDIVIAYETTAREAARRGQAVCASSGPSCRAWISPSRRLRSRDGSGGRRHGKAGSVDSGPARRAEPLCSQ